MALFLKVCIYIVFDVLSAVWSVHSFHFMSTNTLIRCTTGYHTNYVKYCNNGLNGTVFKVCIYIVFDVLSAVQSYSLQFMNTNTSELSCEN